MDIKLSHLESLIAVARLRSFTRAAALLHLSPPALSVQIKQLETSLGVRLLDRNTRSVKLTAFGRGFVPLAQRMVKDLEALIASAKTITADDSGTVCVAAIASVSSTVLPSAIAQFKRAHPEISAQIKDTSAERVVDMVKKGMVDFGIASLNEIELGADVQTLFLFRDRLSAVFTPQNLLARKRVINLNDLLRQPLILMGPETSSRKIFDHAFEALGHFVKPAYEVSRTTTATAMAEEGLGVAILPAAIFEGESGRRVVVRPIQNTRLTREIGVIRKFGCPLTKEATSFLDCLQSVSKRLGLDTRETR
jgi:DNA-binding transcriptional LysR family regulator